jgi:hypothetical protein
VRTTRVKVGNRQAPHASAHNPHPKSGGFVLYASLNLLFSDDTLRKLQCLEKNQRAMTLGDLRTPR